MRPHPFASPRKGVLLDTNLLCVMLVSLLGTGQVEAFKRTNRFTTEDAIGIDNLIRAFGWVCTTPHVLAETSNLLDWLDPKKKANALGYLTQFVQSAHEIYYPSTAIVMTPIYLKLGITDVGLFMVAHEQNLVLLTADLALYHYASGLKVETINFNHIRQQWLTV